MHHARISLRTYIYIIYTYIHTHRVWKSAQQMYQVLRHRGVLKHEGCRKVNLGAHSDAANSSGLETEYISGTGLNYLWGSGYGASALEGTGVEGSGYRVSQSNHQLVIRGWLLHEGVQYSSTTYAWKFPHILLTCMSGYSLDACTCACMHTKHATHLRACMHAFVHTHTHP